MQIALLTAIFFTALSFAQQSEMPSKTSKGRSNEKQPQSTRCATQRHLEHVHGLPAILFPLISAQNEGVYYEAGYAAGLGKEVIHICKKDSFGKDIHFDVKQVNTIIWETEAELTERLSKRIEATIE